MGETSPKSGSSDSSVFTIGSFRFFILTSQLEVSSFEFRPASSPSMAAANLSPPHLLIPLSFPPNKNPNLSPLFNSQNPNRKPQSQQFTSICYFRSSIPNPKFAIPKSSSLSSSTVAEAANAEFPTVATLRELCQGHVPDHVLRLSLIHI